MEFHCGACGKEAPRYQCGRCNNELYCEDACAKRDWGRHARENCGAFLHLINAKQHALKNEYFRSVFFTSKETQYVEMALKGGVSLGDEVHPDTTQYFYIDKGSGWARVAGKNVPLVEGSVLMVPSGVQHNIGAGAGGMWLHTTYSPPHHPPGLRQREKPRE